MGDGVVLLAAPDVLQSPVDMPSGEKKPFAGRRLELGQVKLVGSAKIEILNRRCHCSPKKNVELLLHS